MKKTILWLLVLTMVLLTACSGTPVIRPEQTPVREEAPAAQPETPETTADGQAVKTGLVILPSLASSKDAGEEDGVAQSDMTLVAVTVDENGVIDRCVIDAVQAKIAFSAAGEIVTDLGTQFPTKNQLGADYGMHKASSIGKEWNQQMEALAQYAQGKTVEELRGISLDEKGAAADADLSASVTLSIGGYVDAIAQAVEAAQHLGAQSGDALTLAAVTDMAMSRNAAEDANGQAQAYATVAAVTARDGVVTSCILDAIQSSVDFDRTGKIVTDLSAAPLTKNQLGADYGMVVGSSIGKEWNEQAAAFAAYTVGKTAGEISGIAVNEQGAAVDADLSASVTLSLGAFQQVVTLALQ